MEVGPQLGQLGSDFLLTYDVALYFNYQSTLTVFLIYLKLLCIYVSVLLQSTSLYYFNQELSRLFCYCVFSLQWNNY